MVTNYIQLYLKKINLINHFYFHFWHNMIHPMPPPPLIVAKVTSRKRWSGKRSLAFHYASMLKKIKKNMHHTHMKNVQKLCKIICGKWLCHANLHMNNYQKKILNLQLKKKLPQENIKTQMEKHWWWLVDVPVISIWFVIQSDWFPKAFQWL